MPVALTYTQWQGPPGPGSRRPPGLSWTNHRPGPGPARGRNLRTGGLPCELRVVARPTGCQCHGLPVPRFTSNFTKLLQISPPPLALATGSGRAALASNFEAAAALEAGANQLPIHCRSKQGYPESRQCCRLQESKMHA